MSAATKRPCTRRKYILTVEVPDSAADQIERVLLMVADRVNGRLTRSDYTPGIADGYLTQLRKKTLRRFA